MIGEQGFVYAVHAEGTRYVKVGWSRAPETRLRSLQTGNPHPLRIVHVVACGRDSEEFVHRALAYWCDKEGAPQLRGEWFLIDVHPLVEPPEVIGTMLDLIVRWPSLSPSERADYCQSTPEPAGASI